MALKQNLYSYLYLETHRQETAHTDNHVEKKVARK